MRCLAYVLPCLFWFGVADAQDTEPRRWTHLPVGTNVLGFGYLYTHADIDFNPVLLIDDADLKMHTVLASYVYAFGLLGKSARVDMQVPYQAARWEGTLDGNQASVRRRGFADPRLRFSINLLGAPALKGKAFGEFRSENPVNTILGAGLSVRLPLGDNNEDKLLNLGQNRFIIRPQLGVLHTRAKWSYELTGSVFFFTDNDDFFGGNELEQDPLYAVQAHVTRTFKPGWWTSAGVAYGWAGESSVNGNSSDDERGNVLSTVSFGFPVGKAQGVRIGYIGGRTQEDVGGDSDSILVTWSWRF
jgi:hypothetical protein